MSKLPVFFIPHGGGPCFFMEWPEPNPWKKMELFSTETYLAEP